MPTRLLVELFVIGTSLVALALWLHARDVRFEKLGAQAVEAADKAAAERQKAADAIDLKRASDAHQTELAGLRALYGSGGELHVVRYSLPPRTLPAAPVRLGECPAAGVVQDDARLYRDRLAALELLAFAGDQLAADCRELDSATHPVISP